MLKKICLPLLAAVLLTLLSSAPVQAWGGYRYGYRYAPAVRYGPAFRGPHFMPYTSYYYNYGYSYPNYYYPNYYYPYPYYSPYGAYYYGGVRYGYYPY